MAFTEKDIDTINALMTGGTPPPADDTSKNPPAGDTGAGNSGPESAGGNPPPPAGQSQQGDAPPAGGGDSEDEVLELEKLGFKDFNELQETLNKVRDYEKQIQELSEYKAGPKFKSDRHKLIYDFAGDDRFEGMELNAARQLLEVVSLDLNNLPDQQIRFEAFKLRPDIKGLSQEEIHSLFVAEELERFGNPQDDANPQTDVQKIRAKQATSQAKEQLMKVRNDWDAARPAAKTPEQIASERAEYMQFLGKQLTGFDGISLKLLAENEKGEKLESALNYKLDSEKQLSAITEALADPAGWWDRKLEQMSIVTNDSKIPDFKKFADFVARIEFMDDLMNKTYQQGRADQLADKLKGARNIGDVGESGTGGGAPAQQPVPEAQAAARAAMKVAGMV